jgi:hypothetical protein
LRTSAIGLRRRFERLRKRASGLQKSVLTFRLPHSTVFIVGMAIGLALGLSIVLGITWLDGRRHSVSVSPPVAAIPPSQDAGSTTAPRPIPPVYVEQTEPGPPELPVDAGSPVASAQPEPAPVVPPAVVEAMPPTQPSTPGESTPPSPQPAGPTPANPPASPEAANPEPAWLKNAVASADPGDRPIIAIVLDDVGAAPGDAPGAVALPGPITLSIMTYAAGAARLADDAHRAGHEIMVHVPMEPINRDADPGRNALLTDLGSDQIAQRLDWDLAQFSGYVGINNHMGSKFTQDAAGMRVVLDELKARGLLFLDSRTIASSVGDSLAAEIGVTHVKRDVFLDNVIDRADIMKELARTEAIARKQGYAVAIGHPHPDTIAALRQWIPEALAKGFLLVPISAIAKKRAGVTG